MALFVCWQAHVSQGTSANGNKEYTFGEVSLPRDSLFWAYLLHLCQYFPSPICVLLDTSGREKMPR